MGLLAKHFGGGLSILDQGKMSWDEILKWYEVYELQKTEEEVVEERRYDNKGRTRTLPSPETIREIVNERLEERREKQDEKLKDKNGS